MYVLGINAASHNAAACLVRDGEYLAYHAGIDREDVNVVGLDTSPRREILLSREAPPGRR